MTIPGARYIIIYIGLYHVYRPNRPLYIVGVESKVRISKMLIFQGKQKTSAYLQFYCFLCQISHAPNQYHLNYHGNYF